VSTRRLILRSLWFHARAHLGAVLGAAVGSAVLIGALVVGDSVRASLLRLALLRLGQTELALATGDRLFRAALAGEVQMTLRVPGVQQSPLVAPALHLPAVATTGDGARRANGVTMLGVDARFWQLARQPQAIGEIPPDAVVLSEALARQLGTQTGDSVLFRVQKPSALSRDAPLAPQENTSAALRLRVADIVADEQGGRFSLAANQLPPLNAFVSLGVLGQRVGATNRANLMLVGAGAGGAPASAQTVVSGASGPVVRVMTSPPAAALPSAAATALAQRATLADAELVLREVPAARAVELRTPRVFLDSPVAEAVLGPGTNAVATRLARMMPAVRPVGVLTYFVNELRRGDRATPYSMVTAAGAPVTPADMADEEILITEWLAEDLDARPGDELTLRFFVVGPSRALVERSATFRVRAVLPMNAGELDRDLMPDFPGMTDADNCRDWDTGLPISAEAIRDKDEQYWDTYRGTPKAIITLQAGQRLWADRFGNLTAIRFYSVPPSVAPVAAGNPSGQDRWLTAVSQNVRPLLMQALDPAWFGLKFEPVRAQALAASSQAQDFGQLFLGFSFFLIAAALLLMSVLFQFGLERRATEVGTLLAVGFTPVKVRRLLLAEGAVLAAVGAALGAWGGAGYAQAMVRGLNTVWREAVAGASLVYALEPRTVAIGAAVAILITVLTMWLALRRLVARPALELLASCDELEAGVNPAPANGSPARSRAHWLALACAAVSLGLLGWGLAHPGSGAAGLFFGSGALLLVGGLAAASAWLTRLGAAAEAARLTLGRLGVRGVVRRRRRSLAVIGLLACGSFLIASISVFRLDAVTDAAARSSGTGGFALVGEATQPVVEDLNGAKGREVYNLEADALAGVSFVPCRVRAGDDASCLNLNRAQKPRLLGVRSELLAGRFTFAKVADGVNAQEPWKALIRGEFYPTRGAPPAADEVAAIGDAASIQWALGKKVGDVIPYTDERGREFKLRLVGAVANSILQGNLLIAEEEFIARFPSATGYQMFLIDAPADRLEAVSAELTRALSDLGFEVTRAVERLAAFNAVQNTYLGTFQILGGLGLVLGSVGLGVVVLRNVMERRGELAVLLALGLRRPALKQLVLAEHGALLLAGLGVGVLAALVAVLPSLLAPGAQPPGASLALTLAAVLLNGALWTWVATVAALRGRLLDALRNE
jgi:ABC-type lipoprotein release transport system permease subunit